MKLKFLTIISILAFSWLFIACSDDDEEILGNWVKDSEFDGLPRGNAVAFTIGDKAYYGTGYSEDEEYFNDFWELQPEGYWVRKADFPGTARSNAVSFVANGKGYVGTGYDGEKKCNDFYSYDPDTDTWTQVADFGGEERYGAVAFAIDSYGYVGTGYTGNEVKDFWKYDPQSDAWEQIVSIGGSKRRDATAFVYDGKGYVCTGTSDGLYDEEMYQFDPANGLWSQMTDLDDDDDWNIIRKNATSFVYDGKVYIGTGELNGSILGSFWAWDPALDTWEEMNDFEGAPRRNACSIILQGEAYITGGEYGTYYYDDLWEWYPYEEYDDED